MTRAQTACPTVTETAPGAWRVQLAGELKDTAVYQYHNAFWKCTKHRQPADCPHIRAVIAALEQPKTIRTSGNTVTLPESALTGIVKRLDDIQYLRTSPDDVLMITDELLTAIEQRDWASL